MDHYQKSTHKKNSWKPEINRVCSETQFFRDFTQPISTDGLKNDFFFFFPFSPPTPPPPPHSPHIIVLVEYHNIVQYVTVRYIQYNTIRFPVSMKERHRQMYKSGFGEIYVPTLLWYRDKCTDTVMVQRYMYWHCNGTEIYALTL